MAECGPNKFGNKRSMHRLQSEQRYYSYYYCDYVFGCCALIGTIIIILNMYIVELMHIYADILATVHDERMMMLAIQSTEICLFCPKFIRTNWTETNMLYTYFNRPFSLISLCFSSYVLRICVCMSAFLAEKSFPLFWQAEGRWEDEGQRTDVVLLGNAMHIFAELDYEIINLLVSGRRPNMRTESSVRTWATSKSIISSLLLYNLVNDNV